MEKCTLRQLNNGSGVFTGLPIGNEDGSCARYRNYDAPTK